MPIQNKLLRGVLLAGSTAYMGKLVYSQTTCQAPHPFDTKGFPVHPKGLYDPYDNLTLAGVGMRRKNLYVVEVDVYLIALSLPTSVINSVKLWKKTGDPATPLADVILQPESSKSVGTDRTKVAVTLKFVRSVTKDQIIQAFEDALIGCDKKAIADFRDAMSKVIDGDRGLKTGDILHFDWPKEGGLMISSEKRVTAEIQNPEVTRRMLEVYIDDVRTVSKDLVKCLKDNIDKIETY